MPVEGLQRRIAHMLKQSRSSQTFVGGSSVFNTTFPRRSEDIDVYTHLDITGVARADAATLRQHGLRVDLNEAFYGYCVEANVSDGNDTTKIEWAEADAYRFFPAREDEVFGWIVHRADQAISKLIAAATRRTARDAVDLLLLDAFHCSIEAYAIAAPAKLGNVSPTRILDNVLRNAVAQPMKDYEALDLDRDAMPFEIGEIKLVLADRIALAQRVIVEECARAEIGKVYHLGEGSEIVTPFDTKIKDLVAGSISEQSPLSLIGARTISPTILKQKDPYERDR